MFRLAVLYVFALSALLNCQSNNSETSDAKVSEDVEATQESQKSDVPKVIDLDVQAFMKSLHRADNPQLIDVRTPEEVSEGKIADAQEMDFYDDQFEDQIKGLDPARPAYLYCRSGNRSGKAAKMLLDLGFKNVYNLDGGYDAFSEMQGR